MAHQIIVTFGFDSVVVYCCAVYFQKLLGMCGVKLFLSKADSMSFHDTYTNWLILGDSSVLLSLPAHPYGCRMYYGTVFDVASDLKLTKVTT